MLAQTVEAHPPSPRPFSRQMNHTFILPCATYVAMRCIWLFVALLACPPLPAQRVSTAARQQDLAYISTQLPQLHPNLFFQLDPAQFQQAIAALTARLSTSTDAEFYVGLAQLVALAGDAHTALSLRGIASPLLGFQTFPLTFVWLDDGVFVVAATAPYSRAVGTRLVAVGGMPIGQVIQQLATAIPHANDQWLHYMAQEYLTGLQILQGLHVLPSNGTSVFTFQTLAGDQFTLQLAPGSGELVTAPDPRAGPLPAWLQNTAANYWYSYSAPNRLLYFKYNRCADDPANPFASFAVRLLDTLDRNPVDPLSSIYVGTPVVPTAFGALCRTESSSGCPHCSPTLAFDFTLHTHLCCDFGSARLGCDLPRFEDIMRQRLGTVDMLPGAERPHGDDGVIVVGSGDDHRIDVLLFFVEHLAKIPIYVRFGVLAEDGSGEAVIDVAQGDNTLARAALDIASPHAADPDCRNAKRIARSLVGGAAEDVTRDNEGAKAYSEVAPRGPGFIVCWHVRISNARPFVPGGCRIR
jgi:hypothetical protein